MVAGLFKNRDNAGGAIAKMKEQSYIHDISILAIDDKTKMPEAKDIKKDVKEGVTVGASVGAVGGAIWAGLSSVALPGLGVLVGGSIAALLTGAGAGALTGGLAGALIDYGIPTNMAATYEEEIKKGQVAVAVTTENEHAQHVKQIFLDHKASKIHISDK